MPYKKPYNTKTVPMAKNIPANGGQSHPASIPPSHFVNRPTGNITFEQGTAPRRKK